MEIWIRHLVVFLGILSWLTRSDNYISNGSFDLPQVPAGQYFLVATNWTGLYFDLMALYRTLGHGQFIDLQRYIGQNGYI